MNVFDATQYAEQTTCPHCGAAPGRPCSSLDGSAHMVRFARAEKGSYKIRGGDSS